MVYSAFQVQTFFVLTIKGCLIHRILIKPIHIILPSRKNWVGIHDKIA